MHTVKLQAPREGSTNGHLCSPCTVWMRKMHQGPAGRERELKVKPKWWGRSILPLSWLHTAPGVLPHILGNLVNTRKKEDTHLEASVSLGKMTCGWSEIEKSWDMTLHSASKPLVHLGDWIWLWHQLCLVIQKRQEWIRLPQRTCFPWLCVCFLMDGKRENKILVLQHCWNFVINEQGPERHKAH